MREILFRGKRVDNGEWVEGYYIEAEPYVYEKGIHEGWIVTRAPQNSGWFSLHCRHAIIPESIGQYTGLKDKNGKRIFEGDIVKGGLTLHSDRHIFQVVYDENGFYFRDEKDDVCWHPSHLYDLEVKGYGGFERERKKCGL